MSTRAGNGVQQDWHCLQVSAGAVTRLVGSAVVEERSCDVAVEALPAAVFDLVHARLVLELLPEHDLVLRRLVTAVRPGGWLLAEDLDWATTAPCPAPDVHRRVADAVLGLLGSRGYDPRYGRRLPFLLRREGLADVTALARPLPAVADGAGDEPAWGALVDGLAPDLLRRRLLARGDLDTLLTLGLHGLHECVTPVLVSAWGHRREAPPRSSGEPPAGRCPPGIARRGEGC